MNRQQINFLTSAKRIMSMFTLALCCVFVATAQSDDEAPLSEFSLSFIPDYTFSGSSLDGWHTLGDASWRAQNGEIIGTANSGSGWLVSDKGFQDVGIRTLFKTTGSAKTSLLVRMEETDNGYQGVLLNLTEEDVAPYYVTLDAKGKEISREKLRRAGGISYRMAPPPPPESESRGGGRNFNFQRPEPPSDLPLTPPNTDFRTNDWNQIESFMETNVIRNFLNDGNEVGGAVDVEDFGMNGFGPIALYVEGSGEVRFKELSYKDISIRYTPKETSSDQFEVQCISEFYYSWGSAAADFNKDGNVDIVAGPYIYFGPDFTYFKEIYPAIAKGPSLEFSGPNHQFSYDVNDDGWPDVITGWTVPTVYINPGEESRRWESYSPVGRTQSETTLFTDVDGDNDPELVYAAGGQFRYAKPMDAKEWKQYNVSETGYHTAHGIGVGDVNGDGLSDVLGAMGWWEQPQTITDDKTWEYHPVAFGRYKNRATNIGGAVMAVYDLNGDGLSDVVTQLNVHGFGMAWYEQKKDSNGNISFVRHMVHDDYSFDSVDGVTLSQGHATSFADMDNDGITDYIVGKRQFTHLDNLADPDAYGPPVVYWYRTVRDSNAEGGARLEPELIHNRSGVGSQITPVDLNNDGAMDLLTSTNRGTFIFWNKIEN